MKDFEKAIAVMNEVKKTVIGKDECIVKVMCALLAKGHVLIEDIPGVGKTTMAKAFAKVMQMDNCRMQFTPDSMPSDIVGFKMYRQDTRTFEYQKGAVFCNLFLADEINRTSPRTQSALLEAMEEERVSVEGETHSLPKPFMVIATENPYGSAGTQRLPESQLDRFMICLTMGYPAMEEELAIVKGKCNTVLPEELVPVLTKEELLELQHQVSFVHIDDKVYTYLGKLVQKTRETEEIVLGLSPRATIAIARMAQAVAFVSGRSYVIPEDIVYVFADVAAHRLRLRTEGQNRLVQARQICEIIEKQVAIPTLLR